MSWDGRKKRGEGPRIEIIGRLTVPFTKSDIGERKISYNYGSKTRSTVLDISESTMIAEKD